MQVKFVSIIYNPLIHSVIREKKELSTKDYKIETKILPRLLYKYFVTFF